MCLCVMRMIKNCVKLSGTELWGCHTGQILVRGSSEGIYKHLAGDDWASDISSLTTWDWYSHTPHDSSRPYCCDYCCRQKKERKNITVLVIVCVDKE